MMEVMDTRSIAVVIAVKELSAAKTRLSPGVDGDARRELVLAMLTDTLAAVRAAGLDQVVVVSPDMSVAEAARTGGAHIVVDRGDVLNGDVLNAAFAVGIDHALSLWPGSRIMVLQADLPAVRPESLIAALERSADLDRSFIADHSGTGTTALFLNAVGDSAADTLRFGAHSAREHRRRGAIELGEDTGRWPDLRIDVDTVEDLWAARRLGLGSFTSAVLERLQLGEQTRSPGAVAPTDRP
jgi:2-phospho-L-lactate guanylyltransferase